MTLWGIRERIKAFSRFFADKRASVSVDFVISMPILLAVLVLTSEYGRVLQMRTALDNAVADANRYLARVPFDETCNCFDTGIVAVAEQLITSRINTRHIAISAPRLEGDDDFRTVQLSAAVGVVSPALSVLSIGSPNLRTSDGLELKDVEGLIITSLDTARHFGR